MDCEQIVFSGHAIRQMFQRGLAEDDVLAVIHKGEVIIDYPDDFPYPSYLILGYAQKTPIHVVLAMNQQQQTGIVITAYIPDKELWTDDFKNRRIEK